MGTNAAGKESGLYQKFKEYRDNVWMNPQNGSPKQTPVLMMRDGPSGGGHGHGGPDSKYEVDFSWPKFIYFTQKFFKQEKKLNLFCGVPAWRDDDYDYENPDVNKINFGNVDP